MKNDVREHEGLKGADSYSDSQKLKPGSEACLLAYSVEGSDIVLHSSNYAMSMTVYNLPKAQKARCGQI